MVSHRYNLVLSEQRVRKRNQIRMILMRRRMMMMMKPGLHHFSSLLLSLRLPTCLL